MAPPSERATGHRSVRLRVTVGATLVLAIALLAAALLAAGLLRRALTDDVDTALQTQLARVRGLTVGGELAALLVPESEDLGQLQVVDARGRVLRSSPGLPPDTSLAILPAPAPGEEVRATVDGARIGGRPGDTYRLIAQTLDTPEPITVYAVTSFDTATQALAHLRLGMMIGLPLVLALAAWLIWLVAGRALRPVDAMREEVDRIQATDLTRRVAPAGAGSEIDRLGATLNHLLERLQDAADRQQLFAASASHELRSPLSAIRTELEVGLAYPERTDWPAVAADALVELDRLEALARDLRALTGARHPTTLPAPCDLWALASDEVARRAPARGVRYETDGATTIVSADRNRLAQVVRNLLDNAERHAATTIRVAVTAVGADAVLTVSNDGAPLPPDARERVFEPFMRLDEARSLDDGGSGLGLAIARAVVQAAGGALVALDDADGATFRATIPLA